MTGLCRNNINSVNIVASYKKEGESIKQLKKPMKLNPGDKIATISPCWGVAGEKNVIWRYEIGKRRLEEMRLEVVAAPNLMKGEAYLQNNPKARAEDVALQKLKGMLIGKLGEYKPFDEHRSALLEIVNDKYGLTNLPIMANMNFGHTSPIFILPYGALAEIDCEKKSFSIIESGVL